VRKFNVPGTFPFHPPILSDSLMPRVICNLSKDLYSSTLFGLRDKQIPISRVFWVFQNKNVKIFKRKSNQKMQKLFIFSTANPNP